jgi:8-oxo-dGTP diphosphatase
MANILATLVYVRRPGQTLMLHRIKRAGDMHQGKWNGLGGKLEPGESPEMCAIREVYEESGLRIHNPELRGILTFPDFRADEHWYAFVFVAHTFTGTLIDSAEGALQWIDNDRLLALPLWEGDRIFLPWLDQDRFFSARFVYKEGRLCAYDAVFYPLQPGAATASVASSGPQPQRAAKSHLYEPSEDDDERCWVCGSPVVKRHCKITCTVCGFRRDCSDP